MKKLIMFLSLIILMSGCSMQKENEPIYLSIKNTDGGSLNNYTYTRESVFYAVDLNGKIIGEEKLRYFGNYSGGLYDANENKIYYIDRKINDYKNVYDNNGDQLYAYDLNTKEKLQFTNSLYLNNDVYKDENLIYLISKLNSHGQRLIQYDLKSNNLNIITEDVDMNVRKSNYNPITKEVILSIQSEKERTEAMDKQETENYFQSPMNYIYSYKDGKFEYLFTTEHGEIESICANNDYIVYFINNSILDCMSGKEETIQNEFVTYNRKTKQIESGVLGKKIEGLNRIIYLYENNEDMIGEYYRYNSDLKFTGLMKYNLSTEKSKEIFNYKKNCRDGNIHVVVMNKEN